MEQPVAPQTTAAPPARARWTPAKQRIFLATLMETGNVTHAARAVGMSRSSAQRLRNRLAGTPFDRAWDQALDVRDARFANPFARPDAPRASR